MRQSFILIGALALATVLPSSADAQRIDQTRIIDMHVNAEGPGRSFGARVIEGKRFRMSFDNVGTFELAPIMLDASTFRVTVYRGPEGAASEDLTEVESLTARLGVPVAVRSMPQVGLVIDGVSTVPPSAANPTPFNFAGMAGVQ